MGQYVEVVFHDGDFFLTNGNAHRNCIVDKENTYRKKDNDNADENIYKNHIDSG